MLSPMMTVLVLAVLWLIVIIPMIFRRGDGRRPERSVDGFGRSMRTLGRRDRSDRAEVFVPRPAGVSDVPVAPAIATRRPVPAAQEALMYPVDRSELSAARAHMMARRRRSLGLLIIGTVIGLGLEVVEGGALGLIAVPFVLGLIGYTWFLRRQALRDRERRLNRKSRAVSRRDHGVEATADLERFEEAPQSVVRIDDDDIELQSMDTIDLTGLYTDDLQEPAAQRRAS